MSVTKNLITSSLLDSFDWLKNCPKSWQKKAMDDFIGMLRREKRPTSPECQRGIDFEDLVCKNCNEMSEFDLLNYFSDYYEEKGLSDEKVDDACRVTLEFANRCKGGKQQEKVMKDIVVDGKEYHLFGYADIIFPLKVIYDIKTTTHFKSDETYLKRSQHRIYSICTEIEDFGYLIADYEGSNAPQEFYDVYVKTDIDEDIKVISNRIRQLMKFIDLSGLRKDYEEIFTAKHNDLRNK